MSIINNLSKSILKINYKMNQNSTTPTQNQSEGSHFFAFVPMVKKFVGHKQNQSVIQPFNSRKLSQRMSLILSIIHWCSISQAPLKSNFKMFSTPPIYKLTGQLQMVLPCLILYLCFRLIYRLVIARNINQLYEKMKIGIWVNSG
jgi:hypothetical protein